MCIRDSQIPLLAQLRNGHVFADLHAAADLHAQLAQDLDLGVEDVYKRQS